MMYKPNIPARLLPTGFNAAIENLVISVEKYCAKSIENRKTKMTDSYHLTDIFETLNA